MNNRKRQVILASLKLFVKKGFNNTSIQDILDEAHISKGTFYNYFSSKKDCLISILDIVNSDATLRKGELLIGKRLDDKDVLAAQIATIMQVNKERDLLPIFKSISHSDDIELQTLVRNYHLRETEWLAKRLLDVYGADIHLYRYDATILLFGMINHLLQIGHSINTEKNEPIEAIKYAFKQLDVIVPSLISNKDSFLGSDLQRYICEHREQKETDSQEILKQLIGFRSGLEENIDSASIEFTDGLIDEFSSDKPRFFIISAIAYKFYDSFRDTPHALEAIELANGIWQITRAHKEKINAEKN